MKRKITLILILSLIVGIFSGCSDKNSMTRYEGEFLNYFDTATKIIGYAESEEDFNKTMQFIYEGIGVYHELFDIYNDYEGVNNVKVINDNAGIAPVKVDSKLIEFLIFAKEVYDMTDGNVNIAFGSVLSVWHDYREEAINNPADAKIPPMELLEEANKHTDINKMIIDEQAGTVYLEDRNMRLDVGAIAKGYAVEKVADACVDKGMDSLLFSVGGNVRSIGYKDEKMTPWNVGVQNPEPSETTSVLLTVSLTDKSLVTSGDYQRFYVLDGVRYHHIIDPKTLMPANHFRSVSIITEDSGIADGLSTAGFIMPFEEAKALIEKIEGADAAFVMMDGTIEYTSGFKNHITNM